MRQNTILQAWPMTPAVKIILIVNSALWLLTVIAGRFESWAVYETMALTPAKVYPGWHVWQIFTYMWFHSLGGFSHILFNMLFLWMFGGILEQTWGTRGFLKFYLVCGTGAGVVVFLVGHLFYPTTATVGASGAIYGLVAAWAIAFPERMIYLFGIFPIKSKYFALFPIGYAVLDFIVGGTGISHAAHLGGLAIGALLVTGFWRPRRMKNQVRYMYLKRKLKVIEGDRRKNPPGGRYWN
ncbi:MAG: rhomboid family intramembrane serine protease [Deltaproteobacteria bacterium]|nr:rhomboid family intramembrane serine protease [Deltaproteobacteria bacterium]MBN2673983.1 rhomboid family intramembrane serine protease [Deltaproteobacteria bacterium]